MSAICSGCGRAVRRSKRRSKRPKANEAQRQLARALASLPVRYRETLLLIAVEGLAPAEAAVICGISGEATRQRLSRARALLARRLAEEARPPLRALREVMP